MTNFIHVFIMCKLIGRGGRAQVGGGANIVLYSKLPIYNEVIKFPRFLMVLYLFLMDDLELVILV